MNTENSATGPMDTENEESNLPCIFATVCVLGKRMGFACYDELKNCIVADGLEASTDDLAEIINSIKSTISPTLFLVHPQIVTNKSLLDLLLADINGTPNKYRYRALKSSCWSSESAIETICTKLVVRSPLLRSSLASPQQNYLHLSALIDLEDNQLKQSLSALLNFMQNSAFNLDGGMVRVASVQSLRLHDYLRLDSGSMRCVGLHFMIKIKTLFSIKRKRAS